MGRLNAVLALFLLTGCGARQPAAGQAELRVVAEPADARVYVDDRFVAGARRLAQRPERLAPGVHHVTITASDHFPHDVEVDLPVGVTTIEVSLRPIPP